MRDYKNLRRFLVIISVILTVIPLCLLTYFPYEFSRNDLYKSVKEKLEQIARDKVISINCWMFERLTDAKVIAQSPLAIGFLENHRNKKEFITYLKSVQENYSYYEGIFVYDTKGIFIIGTDEKKENIASETFFISAKAGRDAIADIRELENKPTMFVSCPVIDKHNNIIGVLIEQIKLNSIDKITQEIKVGETGESYLVNKEGYFLTSSKFEPNSVLKKKISTQGFKNCLKYGHGVEEYFDYRGKKVLGSYIKIPEREWCLMVEYDVEEAFSQILKLRNIIIVISIITFLVVLGFVLIISNRIIITLKRKDAELDGQMNEFLKAEKLAAAGKLAAGIAHEIGNPLTGIINCVKLIETEQGTKNEKVVKYLDTISREAMRCNKTIKDFLSFTRESELKIDNANINQVLEDTLTLLTPQLASQGVSLEKKLSPLPSVKVDSIQLEQAFTNIILNSLSAMPNGGILQIQTEVEGNNIVITFSDTGIGISEEHLPKIFEPFFTTRRDGTGLGLTVVYNIIDKHNGSIAVESKVGQGTKFIIKLPA